MNVLKKGGGCPGDISFSLPCCKRMNLLETYIDCMQERVECDYCVSGEKKSSEGEQRAEELLFPRIQ